MNVFDTVSADIVIQRLLDIINYIINELVLCYVDCVLKNKSKENEILFSVIYCIRRKSILSKTQQNPVKAKDSSEWNIQTSEEHKDFTSKNAFECDSSHKQS